MTKFCTQCGATVNETARFCNKCGTSLLPTQPAQESEAQKAQTYQQSSQERYQADPGRSSYPPYQSPHQPPASHSDLQPNIAGMLTYPLLGISGLIFLVLTPYNKDFFVRFHAYQSIFFTAAMIALYILVSIFSFITPYFLDWVLFLGMRFILLGGIGWSMYEAYHGRQHKLPVIGDMAENQAAKH